jgi:divalent metal cation (Fe/Co/Zn/Cd) transporter
VTHFAPASTPTARNAASDRFSRAGQTALMVDTDGRPELFTPGRRRRLLRRGLVLEYATLGWNVLEIGFLVVAAVSARSVALAGFALDSGIEIFASLVVVGQLRSTVAPEQERRALRRIGIAFVLLAVYIAGQAAVTLALGVRPESSPLGIAWLAATCVVMFGLAAAKSRTGRELAHPVLQAEAGVTLVDGALAAGILAGLALNATLGWWWADVAAGGLLVLYGIREGRHHLRASHPVVT